MLMSLPQHVQIMRFWCIIPLLLVTLAACALPGTAPDNTGPLQVAQQFVKALEDRDVSGVLALIEPADWRKEIGPELRSYVGYVERIHFRDPRYAVAKNDGDQASIRLTGTLEYSLRDGPAGERPVDVLLEVVRLDGTWYLRSFDLPPPSP
jgi:hypothetical protein